MRQWASQRGLFGNVLQSAIPTTQRMDMAGRANGLTLRGVVTAVYPYDSTAGYGAPTGESNPSNTIYLSVMCYGNRYNGFLNRVLWTHDRSGLQEGPVDTPKPTSIDITGPLNPDSGSNPANWDGDHVIVGFLEDDLAQPFVLRCIPHPSSDIGNDDLAVGHRMRVKSADGRTKLWKHKGAVFGIDKDGNWLLDLRRAHVGEYEDDGAEPTQARDGTVGNTTILVPEGSKFKVGVTKDEQTADSQDPNPDTNTTSVEFENNKVTVKIDGGTPQNLIMEGGNLTLVNTGDTTLNTDGKVHLGTGASHPVVHGDTYKSDQNTKNPTVKAGWDALAAYCTSAGGAWSTWSGATTDLPAGPILAGAMAGFLTTLGALATAAGAAIQTYDTAVANQLSADVDSK